MDHNEIRHALSEYLDGSLPPADQSIVEEHLKTCASCADALAELRKTIEQVKSLDQIEPPAWMTQKIMARVREEDARKKSVWRYWFFPFRFPIETVGVVLLAVTAFFIYKNTQPVDRFSELSPGTETPAPAQALKKEPAKDSAAPAPRAVPQKPGYKALDMKQEYESPPPPVPEQAPAPAAAAPAARPTPEKKIAVAGARSPDAASGSLKEGQIQAKAKAIGVPGKQEAEPGFILVRLRARGTTQSFEKIDKAVRDASGTVVSRDVSSGALVMTITIAQAKRSALLDSLRTFARAEEKAATIDGQEGFEIVVTEYP